MSTRLLRLFLTMSVWTTGGAQTMPDVVWQGTATNSKVSNPLAISPDGEVAATMGTNEMIQIWHMSHGEPLLALMGHEVWVGALAFSPDGNYLASTGWDGILRVWYRTNWTLAYAITNVRGEVAFSPDAATLATTSDSVIQLRHATNGELYQSWTATSWGRLAFSPDGTKIASGGGFRGLDVALEVWEVPSGNLLWSVPTAQSYGIDDVVFSPDGQQVLTGGGDPVESWKATDGELLHTFPDPAYCMAFSADGSVLATVREDISFYETTEWALLQKYQYGFDGNYPGRHEIALAPTGGIFVRSRGKGEVMAACVPLWISAGATTEESLFIRWVGGTGYYQLQRSLGPTGVWGDEGNVTTATSTTVVPNAPLAFFRVIALPD